MNKTTDETEFPGAAKLPESLGRYRLEQRLGIGGMGEVYRAYDPRLRRHVALKHLRPDRDTPTRRIRLRREARAVALLSHPSIVQVFDILEIDGGDWMVMELLDGRRLADLTASGPLDLDEVLTFGRQIAEGLAAAHAKGIIHRDLKAENVMVVANGDAPSHARILDFGLVHKLTTDTDETAVSETGGMLGTTRAMAPEQARGLEVGPTADLFSLGVLLYEMVTGRSPFRGSTAAETMHRLLGSPADPLPETVPAKLAALIDQLLQKAPGLRPQRAAGVARRLQQISSQRLQEPEELPGEEEDTVFSATGPLPPVTAMRGMPRGGSLATITIASVVTAVLVIAAGSIDREAIVPLEIPPAADVTVEALAPTEVASLQLDGWKAIDHFDQPGRPDRAIEIFIRLIDHDPRSAIAHAGLARAYWRKYIQDSRDRMWLSQAEAVARRAVELDEALPEARLSLGLVLIPAGELEAARRELERVLEVAPDQADAYRGLGDLHLAAGRLDDAATALRRAVELRPGDAELRNSLGTVHFRSDRLIEAEAEFRRSIELASASTIGYRNLSSILIVQERYAEASELLELALEIQPTTTLYSNQGTAFFYQGLYPQAALAFEQALELNSSFYISWANLGDALRQIPHRRHLAVDAFVNAIRLLEPLVERRPEDPALRSRLALYYAKAAQPDLAMKEIARIQRGDGRTHFRMVIAHEVLGQRERALEALRQTLATGFSLAEVEIEPELLGLRADVRFHEIVSRRRAQSSRPGSGSSLEPTMTSGSTR